MIWKILFVIYVLIYLTFSYMGLIEVTNMQATPAIDVLGNYSCEIIIVLALVFVLCPLTGNPLLCLTPL